MGLEVKAGSACLRTLAYGRDSSPDLSSPAVKLSATDGEKIRMVMIIPTMVTMMTMTMTTMMMTMVMVIMMMMMMIIVEMTS